MRVVSRVALAAAVWGVAGLGVPVRAQDTGVPARQLPPLQEQAPGSQTPYQQAPGSRSQYQPMPYQPAPGSRTQYQPTPYQPAPGSPTPYQQAPYQPAPGSQTPYQPTPYQQAPGSQTPYQPAPGSQTPYQTTPGSQVPVPQAPHQQAPHQQAPAPPSLSGPGAQSQAPAAAPPPTFELPNTWVPAGVAKLVALDKVNAQAKELTIKVGESATFESLTILVKACVVRPSDQPADAAVYVHVTDSHPDSPGFDGWMLENEPSVSMMQHPIYDVRVAGCS
jgi:hypothetical protein